MTVFGTFDDIRSQGAVPYIKKLPTLCVQIGDSTPLVLCKKSWGDCPGEPGDYLMVGMDEGCNPTGDIYTMKKREFEGSYRLLDLDEILDRGFVPYVGLLYMKTSEVLLLRVDVPFTVHTLEGTTKADAGCYVAQNPTGENYMLRPEQVEEMYTPS